MSSTAAHLAHLTFRLDPDLVLNHCRDGALRLLSDDATLTKLRSASDLRSINTRIHLLGRPLPTWSTGTI